MIARPKRKLQEHELNLTSLMDVLTVLIFFLVQAFTITTKSIQVPKNIRLPVSRVQSVPRELVSLSISSDEIRGNGALLVSFKNYHFAKNDLASDGRTITHVAEFLKKEFKNSLQTYEDLKAEDRPTGKLMIEADKDIPFSVLKYIFNTATVSGYADYQFLINKKKNSTAL